MRNQRKNRKDLKGTIRYLINLWIIPLVFLLSSPCLAFDKVKPPLSTYPMRYTVYEMTPKELSWE